MSSWLSNLQDLSKGLSAKVQAAVESETFQKLTLSTPELTAQREALQQEYHHKVAVHGSLAHLYPWETRDPERDILVEECKEAIMGLSAEIDTFFGPYEMPALKVKTDDDEGEKGGQDDDDDDDDAEKEATDEGTLVNNDDNDDPNARTQNPRASGRKAVKDKKPSQESLEKLEKLEPLPPLLADFDLLAHVGLIQKMLKIDPKLVERQSTLSGELHLSSLLYFILNSVHNTISHSEQLYTHSLTLASVLLNFSKSLISNTHIHVALLCLDAGGGDREKVFWRNYFFHCAYTRYEAGLSIDEIWSDYHPSPTTTTTTTATTTTPTNTMTDKDEDSDEMMVHFSSTPEPSIADAFAATGGGRTDHGDDDANTNNNNNNSAHGGGGGGGVDDANADHDHRLTESPQSDYEIVQSAQDMLDDADDDDDDDEDAFDGEMDELEAEIAQALGD